MKIGIGQHYMCNYCPKLKKLNPWPPKPLNIGIRQSFNSSGSTQSPKKNGATATSLTQSECHNQPIPSRQNVQQQLQKLRRWYARLNLCSRWEGSDIVWQEYASTSDTNAVAVTISPALPTIWGNTWSQTQWAEELYWPKAPCHKLWSAPRAMLDMHQHTIKALGQHHS